MAVICGALGIDPQAPRQIAMTPRDKKHRRSPFDLLAHRFFSVKTAFARLSAASDPAAVGRWR
jgi:hypothetical protein